MDDERWINLIACGGLVIVIVAALALAVFPLICWLAGQARAPLAAAGFTIRRCGTVTAT